MLIFPFFGFLPSPDYHAEVKMTFEEFIKIISRTELLSIIWVIEDDVVFEEARSFYKLFILNSTWQ